MLSYEQCLLDLAEFECQEQRTNRIERMLRESWLPLQKKLPSLDLKRLQARRPGDRQKPLIRKPQIRRKSQKLQ